MHYTGILDAQRICIIIIIIIINCPCYSIPKSEEIKQIVLNKKLNSIGVLRRTCGVVIGVAERI